MGWSLLGAFQVAVDDFMRVEVVHSGCDLDGPVDGQPRREDVAVAQEVIQRPVRTVLHHHAVARRLRARPPKHHVIITVQSIHPITIYYSFIRIIRLHYQFNWFMLI